MSSVLNKIANAVTGHNNNPTNPNDPTLTGSSTSTPSGLPAGNRAPGVGTDYAGTNYSATSTGALKEGAQVRDTGFHSGAGTGYTGTGTGTGTGSRHHHGTSSSLGSSTSASLGSSTAPSSGSSTIPTGTGTGTGTGTVAGTRTGAERTGSTDDAMTRSEEHLLVGKEKVNVGTAALNKYVTTEKVSTAIPIVREKAVVEREPITEANREAALRGPDFKESHYEMNLMEERAVAEKQTVPIERVRLRKEAEQGQQYVEADLRKEHIELVDPTKEAAGVGRNNAGAGIGKDSTGVGTGTGTGVGSSYSGSNLPTDRQIAANDPSAPASRQY